MTVIKCPKRPKRPKRTGSSRADRPKPSERSIDLGQFGRPGRSDGPGYLQAVLRLAATLPAGGGIHHIAVEHDHECDLLNQRGQCNCNAEVRLMRLQ
jgi:hypothetical protein